VNKNCLRYFSHSAWISALMLGLSLSPSLCSADPGGGIRIAPIAPDMPYVFVVHQGRSMKIERSIETSFKAAQGIRSTLAINSEACPPFCLLPLELDSAVKTVGELEIINFMIGKMRKSQGVLIDVRGDREYRMATIPGSVNIPVTVFQKDPWDKEFVTMLEDFGAVHRGEVSSITRMLEDWGLVDTSLLGKDWDFTNAKDLILWSNGPISRISPTAINLLLAVGYPAEKIRWYRGGLPAWQYWGFTMVNAPKR